MAHDITTLNTSDTAQKNLILKNAGAFSELYPAVWVYDFDGGHTWCTVLGHDKKDYVDPVYVQHIFQGISFIAGSVKKLDYSKAYADSRDTPLRY
jgi:type 1 glutamine amidotransferase